MEVNINHKKTIRVLPNLLHDEKIIVDEINKNSFCDHLRKTVGTGVDEEDAALDCLKLLGRSKNSYVFADNLIKELLSSNHKLKDIKTALYYMEALDIINIQNSGIKYLNTDQLINITDIGLYVYCKNDFIPFVIENIISDYKKYKQKYSTNNKNEIILDINLDDYVNIRDFDYFFINIKDFNRNNIFTECSYTRKRFNLDLGIIEILYMANGYVKLSELIEESIKRWEIDRDTIINRINIFIEKKLVNLNYSGLEFKKYEPIVRLNELGMALYFDEMFILWTDKKEKIKDFIEKENKEKEFLRLDNERISWENKFTNINEEELNFLTN